MILNDHDFSEPFNAAEFKALNPRLGVRVSRPFQHGGLPGKPDVREIETERPRLLTSTSAALAVPSDEWRPKAAQNMLSVVIGIDKAITELNAHRARLLTAAERLKTEHEAGA